MNITIRFTWIIIFALLAPSEVFSMPRVTNDLVCFFKKQDGTIINLNKICGAIENNKVKEVPSTLQNPNNMNIDDPLFQPNYNPNSKSVEPSLNRSDYNPNTPAKVS